MAKLRAFGNESLDLFDFDFDEFREDTLTTKTATRAVLRDNDGGDAIVVKGSGLTYAGNDFSGGTVTQIVMRDNGRTESKLSGLDISAAAISEAAATRNDRDDMELLASALSGRDMIRGGRDDDELAGFGGRDTIYGGRSGDELSGGTGKDILRGQSGNDELEGGRGADKLHGGSGADEFVFRFERDSTVEKSGRDIIRDFDRSERDRIDLDDIDADSGRVGDQDFDFIGTAAFSGTAGELRYNQTAKSAFVYGDVDGDGSADFAIRVADSIALRSGDFDL